LSSARDLTVLLDMQSLALKNEKDDRYRNTMCCRIVGSFNKDSNTLRLDI